VDQASSMGVLQPVAELDREIQSHPGIGMPPPLDPFLKSPAVRILNHDKRHSIERVNVVAVGNVRMQAESDPRLRFCNDAVAVLGVGYDLCIRALDDKIDAPALMVCDVDSCHAAFDDTFDAVGVSDAVAHGENRNCSARCRLRLGTRFFPDYGAARNIFSDRHFPLLQFALLVAGGLPPPSRADDFAEIRSTTVRLRLRLSGVSFGYGA
jgi:hypothetical protein